MFNQMRIEKVRENSNWSDKINIIFESFSEEGSLFTNLSWLVPANWLRVRLKIQKTADKFNIPLSQHGESAPDDVYEADELDQNLIE